MRTKHTHVGDYVYENKYTYVDRPVSDARMLACPSRCRGPVLLSRHPPAATERTGLSSRGPHARVWGSLESGLPHGLQHSLIT